MASLPHNAEASHLLSSGLPSFDNSALNSDHRYQQTPLTACPSFSPTDFEAHLQSASFQQEIHSQDSWPTPAIHHEQTNRLTSGFPFESLTMENCGTPIFTRYGDPHQSFSEMATGSWNGKLSHLLACANGMDSNSMSPVAHGYLSEGVSLAEMMANSSSNVGAKGGTSPLNGFPHPSPLNGKHFGYNLGMNSPYVGLTVDPSKGGLAIQDVNMYAGQSSPLCTLPTDALFADRTAKLLFFNKQSHLLPSASELSHGAADQLMEDGGNSNTLAGQSTLLRFPSSRVGTPSSSTSNSPSGREALQQSAVKTRHEFLNSIANAKADPHTNAYPNLVILEEPKAVSTKKASLLPTLVEIDGSECMGKPCTSVDESDESLDLEVSSSCERDNGWETAMHRNTYGKKKRTKDRSKDSAVLLSDVKDLKSEDMRDKRHKVGDDVNEEDPTYKKVEQSIDSGDSMHLSMKESSKPPEAPKPD
eukprot:c22962_g3_i1 orf=1-1422(-)